MHHVNCKITSKNNDGFDWGRHAVSCRTLFLRPVRTYIRTHNIVRKNKKARSQGANAVPDRGKSMWLLYINYLVYTIYILYIRYRNFYMKI